ncbi:hypothetical protein ABZ016_29470 [Streptomyces sp. NPDC006372]|uniref:hypothetical protein n=1 Tax=Streptomyces sp. NPDC006372 TaxID=3155599 RepID=UPI0033B0586E
MRTFKTVTVALGSAAVLAAGSSPAAADTSAEREWTASHGTASASGTSWAEPGTIFVRPFVIKGELSNTGSECYSAWITFTHDLTPGIPSKNATQCGAGTAPVNFRGSLPSLGTVSIKICRGSTATTDCGPSSWL